VGPVQTTDALHLLEQLPIELYPVDPLLVRAAAEIKSEHTLSYADAFCIGTAQRLNAVVLTDDPEFESVESLIKIRWLTK
jgi:predicted nucleic acid-binding protein